MANDVPNPTDGAIKAFQLTRDILERSDAPHNVVCALIKFYNDLIATHEKPKETPSAE